MKALLLYPDQDFDLKRPLPWNAEALSRDLALDRIFAAMAKGDEFILDVVKKAIFQGPGNGAATVTHRQHVLADAIAQSQVIRDLYGLSGEYIEIRRKHWLGSLSRYPEWTLHWATDLMKDLMAVIHRLRSISDMHGRDFSSAEWSRFFTMIATELSDDYLAGLETHLGKLGFPGGILMSAQLGAGNRGEAYVLQQPPPKPRLGWFEWMFPPRRPGFGFSIHPRDESGMRALEGLRARGLALIAGTLNQAADHVLGFFTMLRTELAFYVGCLNLHDEVAGKGYQVCFPSLAPAETEVLSASGLYDVGLALEQKEQIIGNEVAADGRSLVIVTGANQGGKSTFLRSVGVGQMMFQAGMFVAAEKFAASLRDGIFTHYKREEDVTLSSGKLDEELGRMSEIVDHLTSKPLILFNESFAATNEREGSEISRQILSALLETSARMVCVTHLYELAHGFAETNATRVLFLRAERREDGRRTFRLIEGEPLQTSFGEDLYDSIFGDAPDRAGANLGVETASG